MSISPNLIPVGRLLAAQRLIWVLAAVMLVFGQSIAVGAVQSSDGAWIEICADGGTKMVQTEGNTPQNNCAHCDYCTVQNTASSVGPAAPAPFGPAFAAVLIEFHTGLPVYVTGAEQYWAANRGPPLASEVNMIQNTALWATMTNPVQWGASWL